MTNGKGQKEKQWSTKHYIENLRLNSKTHLKTGDMNYRAIKSTFLNQISLNLNSGYILISSMTYVTGFAATF
jgi:hypothetical protein